MRRPLELVALAALATMALCGCGVTSNGALFSPTDAARHQLANGTWAMFGPGCEVAVGGGVVPECAIPTTIEGDVWSVDPAVFRERFGPVAAPTTTVQPSRTTFLLVEGDPDIMQMRSLPPAAVAKANPAAAEQRGYVALKPLRVGADGRVVSAILWMLTCPPSGKGAPGLQVQGARCVAQSASAVRARAPHLPPLMSFFFAWTGPAAATPKP